MYPDWPESPADLVPLPLCDGPRLKPFDFQGPQNITFLEHIGTGAHSQVFKVEILDKVYALKAFRFMEVDHVMKFSPDRGSYRQIDRPAVIYESNYTEPFNCECRAFGRLEETNNEDLAGRCFGYVLLDEEHEAAMVDKFVDLKLVFGSYRNQDCGTYAMFPGQEREIFLGKNGKKPPFRCIVKEFGRKSEDDDLRNKDFRKFLRDMIKIQQLGIVNLDMAARQIIGGKLSDFSTAYTTPHYILTPGLNPYLTSEQIPAMEYNISAYSICDYTTFDAMIREWNEYAIEDKKHKVSVCALPGGSRIGKKQRYDLRSTPSRTSIFTLVDTRNYDWVGPTPPIFDLCASEMTAGIHNMMIRGLNTMYLQAPHVQPADVKAFCKFIRQWHHLIHHHHEGEEQVSFPTIKNLAGEKDIMDVNVSRHREFRHGLEELARYAARCASGDKYDGAELAVIIDGFGPAPTRHLAEEIGSLLPLRPFGEERMTGMVDTFEAQAESLKGSISLSELSVVLSMHDTKFEGGIKPSWLPMPGPLKLLVEHISVPLTIPQVLKFAPVDASGDLRLLYAGPEDS